MVKVIQPADLNPAGFTNNNSAAAGGINVNVAAGSTIAQYVAAAIAAVPADAYVTGLQSYDASTNVMTLNLADGSTTTVNMTAVVADAVAEALTSLDAGKIEVQDNSGATIGYLMAP